MELMYITNDVGIAIEAEKAGIERIFIDLEKKGKHERQGHLDTHIADHRIEDISKIKSVLTKSKVLVRINPFNEETLWEVDTCIEQGADIIMLPMFKTCSEVEHFVKYINKRAVACLLLETSQAFTRISQILEIDGIDEIHIGLNDLHLSLGLDFLFEPLSEGIVEYLSRLIRDSGIKFGFGGIAMIGQGDVPAEIILGEHYRLGSEMVILSRAFRNGYNRDRGSYVDICEEIRRIRQVENEIKTWPEELFMSNNLLLKEKVREVAKRRAETRY